MKTMFKQCLIVLTLAVSFSSCDQIKDFFDQNYQQPATSNLPAEEIVNPKFVKDFEIAKQRLGTQIGLFVDPHEQGSAFFEIVNFEQKKVTAYEVLEKAHVSKQYHPGYKAPQVFILSMHKVARKKINGEAHDWAFFYYENNDWNVSPKGVGEYELKDGDIIGFSYTAWENSGSEFTPKRKPTSLNSSKPAQ